MTVNAIDLAEDRPTPRERLHGIVTSDGGVEDSRTTRMRTIGAWSARAICAIEAAYVVVFVIGFASLGNIRDPLPDPYLAVGEVLILVMAPIMVALMLAIHYCAPMLAKPFTQVALAWMVAAAAFTTVVHFVELTVARRIDPATFSGYARIFGWQWPSTFYAIDIVAWDVFFGLSLLFAVPAFARIGPTRIVRRGFTASGLLCLIGLIGPFANAIAWREIGILGYTIVFGLTCLPLSRAFNVDVRGSDSIAQVDASGFAVRTRATPRSLPADPISERRTAHSPGRPDDIDAWDGRGTRVSTTGESRPVVPGMPALTHFWRRPSASLETPEARSPIATTQGVRR